ncbi:hypothetical protein TrCOL_g8818 [Triparma columacea]|uniref:FAD dependent oxidoreductase domain-containing protein n=1 Tax=Triparma columacea TaxID=722753 RepID=A0A9W7G8V6_9STRA|nr:hypothetical protein TrCOL_g8818 [Triparma columacea]
MAAIPPKNLLIVGGGIQGASVAYWTSKISPATKITVVEANDRVAPHASGKGGGFLARSWGDGSITETLHHASFDLHEQLAKEWGLKSYRRLPVLSVGAGSRTFNKKGSFHPAWLDGAGGRVDVMGDSSDTAQVHPREFTEMAISQSGATVRLNSKVIGVETVPEEGGGRKVTGVKIEGGELLECDAMVVAMGPWGPFAETWFPTINVPMEGIKSTSVVWPSREATKSEGVALFCGEDDRYGTHIEVYPRPDGTIYCCGVGGSDYIGSDDLKEGRFLTSGCDPNPQRVTAATQALHQISSTYTNLVPDVTQACMRPCPSDALPIMGGVPGFKNAFINCGHNCWGILWAPAAGKSMAELITKGEASTCDISGFDVRRFGVNEEETRGGRGRKRGSASVGEQW